jgi:NADH:ubiquinone oxidoreductase subunit C
MLQEKIVTLLVKPGQDLQGLLRSRILTCIVSNEELVVYCCPQSIVSVLTFLKKSTFHRFRSLVEATAVDQLSRFEVSYCLTSVKYNGRIRVKTLSSENEHLCSCSNIFKSLSWSEREIFDLFGLIFKDHIDLRRILTDYGFVGHPMRKSFPLSGYLEVRYSSSKKRVVLEPLELTQEFRSMDFSSPWLKS